jgi:ketosteroid isomerase-like protein
MEPIANSPKSVVQAFVRAINRQDVDALVALMSPGHRFIDSLGTAMEGREKLRAGWSAYFRIVPDYSVGIEETYTSGPVVVVLGVAQGTYSRDGSLNPENRWQTPMAVRASVEGSQVAEWHVYADNEPIRKVMASGK